MLIILESTTYSGTTHEIIVLHLLHNGLKAGEDVFVGFSLERVHLGNPTYGVHNTPKVVGRVTPACVEVATKLYEPTLAEVVPVSSSATAEMAKLL